MKQAIEITSYSLMYIHCFMTIGTEIKATLKYCLSNLKDCNVGITDGGIGAMI
jgi:hypothetical protein